MSSNLWQKCLNSGTKYKTLLTAQSFSNWYSEQIHWFYLWSFKVPGDHGVELVGWDASVLVSVRFLNHFLKLLLGDVFADVLGDPSEILDWDVTCFVFIVKGKHLPYGLLAIILIHRVGHKMQKIFEPNTSLSISIIITNNLIHGMVGRFESQCLHGLF